jgi:serine-type D-Ala-D-Ala carboxypeptidase (penicillin-binding protein 5/6)
MILGTSIAGGIIVAMQLPLLGGAATATMSLRALDPSTTVAALAWPSQGSAALYIPSLGVSRSVRDATVPIASLTKMMTAFVVLQKLPLSIGQVGPCVTVSASDVATYDYMKSTDQSSVPVVAGETLCESTLLTGLLVHSADNYAAMLGDMVAGDQTSFVALMNETAHVLGLTQTTYADVSGYDPASVSSALDQARLANLLMASPLVRSIVVQPSVELPVGGLENSYTPYVGTNNVIGVKSGRTSQAGGCDVMAMTFNEGATSEVLYAVVLGQRGGDLLGPAGDAALALARSALTHVQHLSLRRGQVVGRVGWTGSHTSVVLGDSATLWWWGDSPVVPVTVSLTGGAGRIRAGQRVGSIAITGPVRATLPLLAQRSAAPLTLLQRLR